MAMIVDALTSQFTDTLSAMAKDEVSLLLGAKDALRQLEDDLRTIHRNLEDAEQKAFTDAAIFDWLSKLRDVVYDADDIIDYSHTKAEKLARLSLAPSLHCYSQLLSLFERVLLRHQMGSRIRSINQRLEVIKKNQSDFNLNPSAPRDDAIIQRVSDPMPDPDIVGTNIGNQTRFLVDFLTSEYKGQVILPILAIVGMAGVGKTTLTQLVYNHPRIKDSFQILQPAWVCVSKECNYSDLINILTGSLGRNPEPQKSFVDRLQLLAETVEGKKFFLVLDDVWSADIWENLLRKPLEKGAPGSRVLITTRYESVAKQMGAVLVHTVQPLSEKDSWSLLCKMVFLSEEEGVERVGDVGMEVIRRCGGLPLAIKAIAGVLRMKERRASEWERVLHNPAWSLDDPNKGVMGVLYLSYQDLPFPLKQCFIFCSLFPEDYVFMRHTLLQYWVAEGFVKGQRELNMEEVAREYYQELLARNLLQRDPRYYDDGGCKMHDLLRSLAQFLSRGENFVGDVKQLVNATASSSSSTTSVKLRHLSIVDRELHTVPETVEEQKSLRTLLFINTPLGTDVHEDFFKKFGCLRVLDMSETNLTKLPISLGNLLHLRYLDLSFCSMAELPQTIGNLTNLQYLILQRCKNLHRLPGGIAKLYKLRSLDLLNTPVDGLPAGLGMLRDLNRLMGFVANEDVDGGWCSLEELRLLSQMKSLTVGNLEKALIRANTRESLFRDKRRMTHLELYCKPNEVDGQIYGDEQVQNIQRIFEEELFPPPSIEKLEIKGYFGIQFPRWITARDAYKFLPQLRRLDLEKCGLCKQLPPLGQLPNLDFLNIQGASAIQRIEPEFFGRPSIPFPRLETLQLKDMPSLIEWHWEAEDGVPAMPRLQQLQLIKCPNLRCLPGGLLHVRSLTTLIIQGAESLTVIENLVSLRTLLLMGNPNLVRVSNLPALQTMLVDHCATLSEVEGLHSLQNLKLQDLFMQSLPEWLLLKEGGGQPSFPVLERLDIFPGGPHVIRQCLEGCPDWPKIQHFSHVYIQCIFGREFLFYDRDSHTFKSNLGADDADDDYSSGATDEEN